MNRRCLLGAISATLMALLQPLDAQAQQDDTLNILCRGVTRLEPRGTIGSQPDATTTDLLFKLDLRRMTAGFHGHTVTSRHPFVLRVNPEFYELDWNGRTLYLGATVTREYITIGRYTGSLSHHILQLADGRTFSYIRGGQCERVEQRF